MQNLQDTSPTSAAAVTALLSMRQGNVKIEEPRECYSTPALDLCIRRRDRTPPSSPEGARYLEHMDGTPTTTTRFSNSPISQISDSSVSSLDNNIYPPISNTSFSTPRVKPTRPFKAYPKDPMVLALGVSSSETFLGGESTTEAYTEFRNRVLSQTRSNHGVTNKNMRRSSLPVNAAEDPNKDEAYWNKRRKNNEAAKRSRDARRAKEDEIAIRAAFLEHENLKLKYENASMRKEIGKMRRLVYGKNNFEI